MKKSAPAKPSESVPASKKGTLELIMGGVLCALSATKVLLAGAVACGAVACTCATILAPVYPLFGIGALGFLSLGLFKRVSIKNKSGRA